MPSTADAPSDIDVRWHRLIVPFDRLPNSGTEDFHLGFQLRGPGTIWLDDISLYQVSFTPNEIKALQRLVLAAGARCSQNRVSDLLAILEGYWARFLFAYVPETPNLPSATLAAVNGPYAQKPSSPFTPEPPAAAAQPAAQSTSQPAARAGEPEKVEPGFFDRVKGFFGRY